MQRIHATCVEIEGHGVLLRGASGSGKSDLALRLIHEGAHLVADDYTVIERRDERLLAAAPPTTAGKIEVRGVGLVNIGGIAITQVRLVVDLVKPEEVERMPEPQAVMLLDVALPCFKLAPFEAAATAKVRTLMKCVCGTLQIVTA
ncbi:MAG: hypothetical protein A2516_06220 [Alphaproteobacteria bacterium RIFOXYD12_FULL_60_8]|nr:MAG: hypothetical protein A2516_06220 [Alphaproteobacteria bacterium RIFOXYD12_FULL_60_8]